MLVQLSAFPTQSKIHFAKISTAVLKVNQLCCRIACQALLLCVYLKYTEKILYEKAI